MYVILSFVGDFPVHSQPYWNREYSHKGMAIKLARLQHKILSKRNVSLYTIVIDKESEDVVEWMIYKDKEYYDKLEASYLADSLWEENNVPNG
jgi:hypothetical protein